MTATVATANLNTINSNNNTFTHLSNDFKSSLDNFLQYQKGLALLNDRYSFVNNLQTGSFGKVSLAFDHHLNTKVAIKALKKSVSGVKLMANHEVNIMKSLGYHKNITQLLDFFETKKYYVLVLEFADSGDLYDAIHNKTNLGKAFQSDHLAFNHLLTQLLEVVNYCHSKGIYHRDIKPENILLMNDGTIKLCDWGLSTKLLKCSDFNVGTEKYMAPEALVKVDKDHYFADKIDIYSIGITLLFTLYNKCPFRKALEVDPNYSNFLKSKSFIYDFYTNINLISFTGIIDMLMINRDLNGLKYLIDNGLHYGYTIDQEYAINFSKQQNNYINSMIDSINETSDMNDSNNDNDVFLFDEFDNLHENNEILDDDLNNDNSINNSSHKINFLNSSSLSSVNVNPISIPLPDTINYNNSNKLSDTVISNATPFAYNSLFDSQTNINNSFINSFDVSNDIWGDQLNDIRYKFNQ